jgi:hypothetical protein
MRGLRGVVGAQDNEGREGGFGGGYQVRLKDGVNSAYDATETGWMQSLSQPALHPKDAFRDREETSSTLQCAYRIICTFFTTLRSTRAG